MSLNSGLIFKWLKSENTSSLASREIANKTRKAFKMTHKQYRKLLSYGREKTKVLERIMSENRWSDIDFSKIPSRAGLIYKNAFARHDIERMKNKEVQSYADFAKDETKKVNAKVLYPYECVAEALKITNYRNTSLDDTNRLMVNKYWDNLEEYFNGATFNGMAVVDTSGSMCGSEASAPINVALSLGLYCAERAKGPYHNHFITFSSKPTLVKVEGVDFCDKVRRMTQAEWGMNTNVEAVFDLMLKIAIENHLTQDEIPENLIIISDQEYDDCATSGPVANNSHWGMRTTTPTLTLFEQMEKKWNSYGYNFPKLVFWNVEARHNNIPMTVRDGISFVSGMSPTIYQQIMMNKSAFDLMYEVLDGQRYQSIH